MECSENELALANTNITRIPDSVYDLTHLTHLDLSHNQIYDIPESLIRLTKLTHLDLSFNRIKVLYYPLPHLHWLNVASNDIRCIYDYSFKNLERLMYFDYSSNPIEYISSGLVRYLTYVRRRNKT